MIRTAPSSLMIYVYSFITRDATQNAVMLQQSRLSVGLSVSLSVTLIYCIEIVIHANLLAIYGILKLPIAITSYRVFLIANH